MSTAWPLTARDDDLRRLATRHADPESGGTVLTGSAGVGKTRLAETALAAVDGPVARAVGHPSTRDIPLGALAHLLPPRLDEHRSGSEDLRAELFHHGRAELIRRAEGGRLTLLVDDVDQLDDTSLALLHPLTIDRTLCLVVTLRAGRPLPPVVAALVKDGHLVIDTVEPLDRPAVVAVLARAMGMPIDGGTVDRLVELSDGNLQVLIELVHAARVGDEVRIRQGMWSIDRIATSGALEELVASHLADLSDDAITATEILATAGWLRLEDMEVEVDRAVVEDLELGGLVRIRDGDGHAVVELAHPVYGEVIRQRMPRLRTRSIQGRLADRLQARGLEQHDDVTRLAWWRIESGGDVDPDILIRAGHRAVVGRDHRLAARFAAAAADRGATFDAARISVEAAVLAADAAALEAAVERVWDDPSLPDELRADLARRVSSFRFAGGDLDGALAAIDDARRRLREPTTIAAMDVQHAQLLATSGRPEQAVALLASVPDIEDNRLELERASAESVAWTSLGRFGDGARRGTATRRSGATPAPGLAGSAGHGVALGERGPCAVLRRSFRRGHDAGAGRSRGGRTVRARPRRRCGSISCWARSNVTEVTATPRCTTSPSRRS